MSGANIGVIAQDSTLVPRVPTADDVVFLSTWDGTNGGTNAVDESILHAPITFTHVDDGSTTTPLLSNEQHLFDAACSLKVSSVAHFCTTPFSSQYNIGTNNANFTIETFIRVIGFQDFGAMQCVGLWRDNNFIDNMKWRMVIDATRLFLQARTSAGVQQYSVIHNMLTDTWYFLAICRYAGQLRMFMGQPGGMTTLLDSRRAVADWLTNATSPGLGLWIGGNAWASPYSGSNAYYQHMRVSKAAWYPTDGPYPVPDHKFGFGVLRPSLVVDTDTFYTTTIGQVVSAHVPHDDVFYSPTITKTPGFVNSTTTSGTTGSSATPPLVGSRSNGNVLICWIAANAGAQTFAVGGGWTIGDQQSDANSSACWAWRVVDGTEAAPTFTFGGASIQTRMFQFAGTQASPIGAKHKAQGASANLIVNGGAGLTTTATSSMVLALALTTANSQVIPLPPGYQDIGSPFNNAFGSNRQGIQPQGASGSVSSPINLTITAAFWHGFLIELKV